MRRALRPLPDALKYKQVAKAIEAASGEATAQQAYSALYAILKSADESMVKKIKQVVDRVADKVGPIGSYLTHELPKDKHSDNH